MKNNILYTLIIGLLIISCTQPKYTHIGQEIIDGRVSAVKEDSVGSRAGNHFPKIWVQNAKETKEVEIPFEYEGKWKVGDSCLLIIEKYKENEMRR
jgi:hypothetical protein